VETSKFVLFMNGYSPFESWFEFTCGPSAKPHIVVIPNGLRARDTFCHSLRKPILFVIGVNSRKDLC
jgi:hypothetical protein